MAEIKTAILDPGTYEAAAQTTGDPVASGSITVALPAAPNQPPELIDEAPASQAVASTEDNTIDVLAFFTDPEGQPLTATGVSSVASGLDFTPTSFPTDEPLIFDTDATTGGLNFDVTVSDGTDTTTETCTVTVLAETGSPDINPAIFEAGRSHFWQPDWGVGAVSVEITGQPGGEDHVGADGLTLYVQTIFDPTDTAGKTFDARVTYADASFADVSDIAYSKTACPKPLGIGLGKNYRLAAGDDGKPVMEPAEDHRDVYVSKSASAWSIAEIEAEESTTVNGAWLNDHPEYGTISDPLDEDAANALDNVRDGLSTHWYIERGYTYSNWGPRSRSSGLSPLHPQIWAAYGTGDRPEFPFGLVYNGARSFDIALIDLAARNVAAAWSFTDDVSRRWHFYGCDFTDANGNLTGVEDSTLEECMWSEIAYSSPSGSEWHPFDDKGHGLYLENTKNIHFEGCLGDHCAWSEGYRYDCGASGPAIPSKYSHDFYDQGKNASRSADLTSRAWCIALRAPSLGFQQRGAVLMWGSTAAECNEGMNVQAQGGLAYLLGTTVVGAGYKITKHSRGANGDFNTESLGVGIVNGSLGTVAHDVQIINSIDPDHTSTEPPGGAAVGLPSDGNTKTKVANKCNWSAAIALKDNGGSYHHQDVAVSNWRGSGNIGSIDHGAVETLTLRRYAAAKMGGTPTTDQYAEWVKSEWRSGSLSLRAEARNLEAYFMQARGLSLYERASAATVRAIGPNHTDGYHWGNPYNWSSRDIPGEDFLDTVDLSQMRRGFNFGKAHVAMLRNGRLDLWGGKLLCNDVDDVDFRLQPLTAAQLWLTGGALSSVSILAEGGRVVNSGVLSGSIDVDASGEEFLLAFADGSASSWTIDAGSTVEITGGMLTGFDGSGGANASLVINGTLRLVAADGVLPEVREFRSGIRGTDAISVASAVSGSGTIEVDATGMGSGTHDLIDVDSLTAGSLTLTKTAGPGTLGVSGNKVQLTVA